MHRRTANALGQVPAPSRKIDFRDVGAPPGWGRVIPFVPRRKTPPVPAPAAEKADQVQEVADAVSSVPTDQALAEQIAYHRFLMGEGGANPLPAAEPRQESIGLVKKPTPPKVIAQARGRRQEEIAKALKNGRKAVQGRTGAGPAGRPTLSSSQYGIRHPRSAKKKSSSRVAREPRSAKRPEPLPTLDDALFLSKAEHAWKRCNPPRMSHHEEVLYAALVIRHGETAFSSVVDYLVQCARLEVAQTQESGEQVTYGLLRRIIDRALGLLVQHVWNCVKHARPYDSDTSSDHPHRLSAWERRRNGSTALSPFSIYVCRHPTLTDDQEVFFMLERAGTGSPIIHALMSEAEFCQRLRKLKPCCQPIRPSRPRIVQDEEEGEEGIAS